MSLVVLIKNANQLRGRYDRIARVTFRGKKIFYDKIFPDPQQIRAPRRSVRVKEAIIITFFGNRYKKSFGIMALNV